MNEIRSSVEGTIKKPSKPPHYKECKNPLSFFAAYEFLLQNPTSEFFTTGNGTPFNAKAAICSRGKHKGKRVIRFFTHGTEKGRAYECCWGHITNCSRTYIDCFTKAITKEALQ